MIACSIAVNSGSNAETMPMRSNSAEEPRRVKKELIKNRRSKTAQRASHGFMVLCYLGCSIGAISCGRGPVFKMIGKHETIILQKDFEHGRRYRHLFRSWIDFVESCCRNEGQHIFNSWPEKFLFQCTDPPQIPIS